MLELSIFSCWFSTDIGDSSCLLSKSDFASEDSSPINLIVSTYVGWIAFFSASSSAIRLFNALVSESSLDSLDTECCSSEVINWIGFSFSTSTSSSDSLVEGFSSTITSSFLIVFSSSNTYSSSLSKSLKSEFSSDMFRSPKS